MISRLLLALPLAALTAIACSSSSGGTTPCNANPWQCPAGQTCWPQDQSSFACLNVGAGKLGDPCTATVGMPTCGANLDCLQTQAASPGTCVAYCSESDPSHACPAGVQCVPAYLGSTSGPKFNVCAPSATQDAGSDSGSGSGSGSSSGGSGSSSGTSSDSGSGSGSGSGGDAASGDAAGD